jgi:hypothetical protein
LGFSPAGPLLSGLLGNDSREGVVKGAAQVSDFIVGLMGDLEDRGRVRIDRPYWSRGYALNSWVWVEEFFFLVDPSPYSGPERVAYVVAVRIEQDE